MQNRDVVADLGYLALGTRLKRLAEQLQAGVAEVLTEGGATIQPGQLPLLVALRERDGASIAEIVRAIGVSQPAISRMVGALQKSGLVQIAVDDTDSRSRRVRLTAKSRGLLDALDSKFFPKVAAAAADLCSETDLLDCLATAEVRNREMPFAQRIRSAKS